jgi:hypothetical protein
VLDAGQPFDGLGTQEAMRIRNDANLHGRPSVRPAPIATATGTKAAAMYRVLQALAGAFAEDESGHMAQ